MNNVSVDYTHLLGNQSVMNGGMYVYSSLNANEHVCNLAFLLSPANEVCVACYHPLLLYLVVRVYCMCVYCALCLPSFP